jgi:hypothetical protein
VRRVHQHHRPDLLPAEILELDDLRLAAGRSLLLRERGGGDQDGGERRAGDVEQWTFLRPLKLASGPEPREPNWLASFTPRS